MPDLDLFGSMSAALREVAPVPGPVRPPEPVPAPALDPVRVQPVPVPAAFALPPARGLDRERQWLRRSLSQQYDSVAGSVARMLSQAPGLRGGARPAAAEVLADLVAVRLYLSGEGYALDEAVRTGQPGPHVPLARCVTAGLRRLPSYRGPAFTQVDLDEAQWRWYRQAGLVTEWACYCALTEPYRGLPGPVQLRIWSMTARRTALIVPEPAARVVFLPGTRFKVLRVDDGPRRAVLLRELSPAEVGPAGEVQTGEVPLDRVALSGLDGAGKAWQEADPAGELTPGEAGRFGHPIGLLAAAKGQTS
jgi:hypothetical protein